MKCNFNKNICLYKTEGDDYLFEIVNKYHTTETSDILDVIYYLYSNNINLETDVDNITITNSMKNNLSLKNFIYNITGGDFKWRNNLNDYYMCNFSDIYDILSQDELYTLNIQIYECDTLFELYNKLNPIKLNNTIHFSLLEKYKVISNTNIIYTLFNIYK